MAGLAIGCGVEVADQVPPEEADDVIIENSDENEEEEMMSLDEIHNEVDPAPSCTKWQGACNVNNPNCCPGLGCLMGLYGGPARCVELGCVNGPIFSCGPDNPSTVCCTGVCYEQGDGSYKCTYF